jgi:hypothetical protein
VDIHVNFELALELLDCSMQAVSLVARQTAIMQSRVRGRHLPQPTLNCHVPNRMTLHGGLASEGRQKDKTQEGLKPTKNNNINCRLRTNARLDSVLNSRCSSGPLKEKKNSLTPFTYSLTYPYLDKHLLHPLRPELAWAPGKNSDKYPFPDRPLHPTLLTEKKFIISCCSTLAGIIKFLLFLTRRKEDNCWLPTVTMAEVDKVTLKSNFDIVKIVIMRETLVFSKVTSLYAA